MHDRALPVGRPVPNWTPRTMPPRTTIEGHRVKLEALSLAHAADLFAANAHDESGANWTYLPYGPFATLDTYRGWIASIADGPDPAFFAIIDKTTEKPVGVASLMRIDPANGVVEVGHIHYSPLLQRRPGATEAMFLLMRHVFDELGYRRYEWKCDSLNTRSRSAALRLGFTFEGTFRQAVVMKGRNRDTAWFSIIDGEWPALRTAFKLWLEPGNFDEQGGQRRALSKLIAAARA